MVRLVTAAAPGPAVPAEQRLADAVEQLGRLPVLSATVRRVQAIAESEDAGIGDMVAALEADQGLATDLLRYANSAACARPLRARNIRAAVTLVGRKAIAQLAVAGCSQAIAERTGSNVDVAHLSGLLHDVGKLVMPLAFGTDTLDAIVAEFPAGSVRAEAEHKRLGVDHAAAGAMVAAASQVEEQVAAAIAFHHGGLDSRTIASRESPRVIVADEIVGL